MKRAFFVILPLVAACNRAPESYPPPAQKQEVGTARSNVLGAYVSMSDPNAGAYIVGGVSPATEAGSWRWTYRRPQLRFYLQSVQNLKFAMDFAIAQVTFAETGPITITVLVNDKPVGKRQYAKPGKYLLEMPVPAEVLRAEAVNTVTVEPDKVYIAKEDKAELGLILASAGFRD